MGRQVRVSVLFVHPVIGLGKREQQEVSEADGSGSCAATTRPSGPTTPGGSNGP